MGTPVTDPDGDGTAVAELGGDGTEVAAETIGANDACFPFLPFLPFFPAFGTFEGAWVGLDDGPTIYVG